MSRNWVREQGRPSSSFHGGRQQTKPQITNATKEKNGDEREPLDWRLLQEVDVCPEAERVRRGIVGQVAELPEVDHVIKACLGSQKGQCD